MRKTTERWPEDIRRVIDQRLSALTPDPDLARRVIRQAKGDDKQMTRKKKPLIIILAAALVILTTGAAVAEIIYNQSWYYDHRYTNIKNTRPDTYRQIMEHLAQPLSQTNTDNSLVDVTVQDVAWVPDQGIMTFSLRAVARDPARYELHSMLALDTDGAYVGEGGEERPDSDGVNRARHWLWVGSPDFSGESKFGPPDQVMLHPEKTLLLLDNQGPESDLRVSMYSYDSFTAEDGSVILVYELQLDREAEAPDAPTAQVSVSYRAREYREGMEDSALYTGGEAGTVTFTVSLQ